MISVILPAYNAEDYIQRAIDSILAQTYSDFELIVINDGSSDNTWKLIESYTDKRMKPVNLEQNRGLIGVLNLGLSLATGKYIARMDADDISLPDRFKEQVAFLDANEDYVACGCSIINFNDSNESFLPYPTSDQEIRAALTLFERNICHPTVMLRTDVIKQNNIQYQKAYPHAEDYMFWIDLAKYGKLHNLAKAYLKYFRHEEQISSKYYPEQMEISRQIVREQFIEHFPSVDKEKLAGDISFFLIHEDGVGDNHLLISKKAKETADYLIRLNETDGFYDAKSWKKIVAFKLFRCSVHYGYSAVEKLRFLGAFLLVSPQDAYKEFCMLVRLYYLLRIKQRKNYD